MQFWGASLDVWSQYAMSIYQVFVLWVQVIIGKNVYFDTKADYEDLHNSVKMQQE